VEKRLESVAVLVLLGALSQPGPVLVKTGEAQAAYLEHDSLLSRDE
jgi:hypothetical protein